MPPMKDVVQVNGKAIRIYRKRLGMSQQALADAARISRSYLSELELAKKTPGRRIVQRIADIFDVDFEELVVE